MVQKQDIDMNMSNSEQTGAHSTNPFTDDSLQGYPQYTKGPNGDNAQPGQDFQQQSLKLPAASPYDNFLRAAGC
jgi:protein EFR3